MADSGLSSEDWPRGSIKVKGWVAWDSLRETVGLLPMRWALLSVSWVASQAVRRWARGTNQGWRGRFDQPGLKGMAL